MTQPYLDIASPLGASGPSGSGPSRVTLDALVDNMRSETRLLEELTALMRRQRHAVAADDLQGVDDSVYGTQRVLLTLGEARRRRRSLNRLIGESEDLGLKALERVLGPNMTDAVRGARDGLQSAALTLSQEVDLNRRVLREALAAGDDYVRAIYGGASETRNVYVSGTDAAPPARSGGGVLINRRA